MTKLKNLYNEVLKVMQNKDFALERKVSWYFSVGRSGNFSGNFHFFALPPTAADVTISKKIQVS